MLPPLARVDSSLDPLTACEHLSLSSNAITNMPSFGALTRLRILSIGRNQLKRLEHLADVAGSLEQLWASYNQIETLTNGSGLERCRKLTHLYLSNNKISKLDELLKISHLPLSDLILTGNPCCVGWRESEFRLQVLRRLPRLAKIDGFAVTERERVAAAEMTDEEAAMTPEQFQERQKQTAREETKEEASRTTTQTRASATTSSAVDTGSPKRTPKPTTPATSRASLRVKHEVAARTPLSPPPTNPRPSPRSRATPAKASPSPAPVSQPPSSDPSMPPTAQGDRSTTQ